MNPQTIRRVSDVREKEETYIRILYYIRNIITLRSFRFVHTTYTLN